MWICILFSAVFALIPGVSNEMFQQQARGEIWGRGRGGRGGIENRTRGRLTRPPPWCAAVCCGENPGRRKSQTTRRAVGRRWSGAGWSALRQWRARPGPRRSPCWRRRPRWWCALCGEVGKNPWPVGAPWCPSRWCAGTPQGSSSWTGPNVITQGALVCAGGATLLSNPSNDWCWIGRGSPPCYSSQSGRCWLGLVLWSSPSSLRSPAV